MRHVSRKIVLPAAVAALLSGAGTVAPTVTSASASASGWSPRTLASDFYAAAINERGWIVGGFRDEALVWKNGKSRALPEPAWLDAYDYPSAAAINDAGDIAGYTWEGSEHALFWPRSGGVRTLATIRERDSSGAADINNRGQIVGWSGDRAVVWEGGRVRALPGRRGEPSAINDRGLIVGSVGARAALWENETLRILASTKSAAVDINNRGQVVGWRTGAGGKLSRGFLWENGGMVDLAGFMPAAINDRGQIVGSCSLRACVWQRGRITKLRDLGYSYPVATGINERQQVVGSGQAGGGQLMPYSVAILWTFEP